MIGMKSRGIPPPPPPPCSLAALASLRVYSHTCDYLFVVVVVVFAAYLKGHPVAVVVRTMLMVALGLGSQYWLLIHVSGFLSPLSALLCMLVCRAMFSVPYIHVNIFQVRNTCSYI